MKTNEKTILEILLAIILIVLIILLIFLFTNLSLIKSPTEKSISTSISTPSSTSGSYNVNSYNTYISYDKYPTTTKYYPKPEPKKNYRYLRYSSKAEHQTSLGIMDNEKNRYIVYVKNKDYKTGYFKVKFYFTDYYGNTRTESIRHYIKPDEEKKFFYQSIYNDKYKYYNWHYEVISETKVF